MSIEINITQPKCIDGESLQGWLSNYLKDDLNNKKVYLLPDEPFDCTSESNTFAAIDIDNKINKTTLLSRKAECSNERELYFYIQDVVEAACGEGILKENYYHVFHKNSH